MDPNSRARDAHVGHLPLPDNVHAPRLARRFLRDLVERWAMSGLLEPLTLVVSELVTNAVRHGRPPFHLSVRRLGKGLRVEVQDGGGGDPGVLAVPLHLPSSDERGGRGLFIVQALSSEIGVDKIEDNGKRVWAVVQPEAPACQPV